MLYRIADNYLRLEGFESKYFERRMKAYEVPFDNGTSADITVTFINNECITVPAGKDFRRHDAWYWIDRGGEGYSAIKQFTKHRINMMRMDVDKKCSNVTIEYVDLKDYLDITTDYMLYFALNDIFAFCQTVRNSTLLHSTAISYKGESVLFSAPSETGKSTQAGLWKKFYPDDVEYFNDDTPVIREENGTLYAFGTPWSGKTEINLNVKAPLKAIICLKQAPENSIRRLSPIEAAIRLLNETRKPVFENLMDKHMDILNKIITKTPVYELSCTISREAVDLVKNTLFKE